MTYVILCDLPTLFGPLLSPSIKMGLGVPFVAQKLRNLTRIHEDVGLIPGLAWWVGDLALL